MLFELYKVGLNCANQRKRLSVVRAGEHRLDGGSTLSVPGGKEGNACMTAVHSIHPK